MNGMNLLTYIRQCLAPTLARGDIVILDNLKPHKAAGVRVAIKAVGAHLRHLSPYSPDLNPIALLFAKLKALFRKAAGREVDARWTRIGKLLDAFTTDECPAYLRHTAPNTTARPRIWFSRPASCEQ